MNVVLSWRTSIVHVALHLGLHQALEGSQSIQDERPLARPGASERCDQQFCSLRWGLVALVLYNALVEIDSTAAPVPGVRTPVKEILLFEPVYDPRHGAVGEAHPGA